MHTRSILLVAALVAAGSLRPAAAAPTAKVILHADAVNYYSNRFVLTADGHVNARLSDGTVITGQTFAMDLKLNRFIVAGAVHVKGPGIDESGAAFSAYPDIDRSYFLPEGDVPDRWTFFGQDYTNHHAGRDQPGDAFNLPDTSGARPFIKTTSAVIYPKNNVEFPFGATKLSIEGAYVATPGWVVNFSSNSNFYQNAYAGAVFDIQVPFRGSANDITSVDVRYEQYRGAYISAQEHVVHNLDYYVFSINPLTQDLRQWNLIAYKRESPALETRLFSQLTTNSKWPWSEPKSASSFNQLNINTRVGRYAVQLSANQFNNSLLPSNDSGLSLTGLRIDGHPFSVQLAVQSFEDEFRFFRYLGVPLKFQYRAGYGYNYDGFGILQVNGSDTWGGALYPLISQTFVGATVYTPSIRLVKQISVSAKYDKQRQWFSLPHHIDTDNFSATVAYTPQTTKLPAAYISYGILNIGDFYGKDQLMAYPPFADTVSNQYGTFSGLAAFRGFATSRTLTGSAVYTPTQYFALNVTLQHFDVTPAPVPGLGGQPPWQVTADVRVRLTANLLVDVARSYYFNFGDQRWSPQFAVTLSP